MQSYKGAHQFFKRNVKLFTKRLTVVQSSFQEVKESMEGALKHVGAGMGKASFTGG